MVRDRRAELAHVVDAAEQVPEVGVGLADHRRAALRVVADEDVDLVAAQQRLSLPLRSRQPRSLRGARLPGGRPLAEAVALALHVRADRLDEAERLLLLAPALAQRLEEVLDREARDLLVELLEAFLRLPLEPAHREQRVLDQRLQLVPRARLDLLALLRRQRRDRLLARGLAVDDRCGDDAAGRQLQREPELSGLLLQLLQHRGATLLLLLQHRGALADVGVGVERLAQLRARVLHGAAHRLGERAPLAGRERDAVRSVGVLEVVDVDPVRRRLARFREALQVGLDDRGLADAVRPGGVEVVAARLHAERELDRADGALLAEDGLQRVQVRSARERQRGGVAAGSQRLGADLESVSPLAHRVFHSARPAASRPAPPCRARSRGDRSTAGRRLRASLRASEDDAGGGSQAMRAAVVTEPGGPEVLRVAEIEDPVPGPDEALVAVHASALNRADLMQRRGGYPRPARHPPGRARPGDGRRRRGGRRARAGLEAGDRVMALLGGGGYARAPSRTSAS